MRDKRRQDLHATRATGTHHAPSIESPVNPGRFTPLRIDDPSADSLTSSTSVQGGLSNHQHPLTLDLLLCPKPIYIDPGRQPRWGPFHGVLPVDKRLLHQSGAPLSSRVKSASLETFNDLYQEATPEEQRELIQLRVNQLVWTPDEIRLSLLDGEEAAVTAVQCKVRLSVPDRVPSVYCQAAGAKRENATAVESGSCASQIMVEPRGIEPLTS